MEAAYDYNDAMRWGQTRNAAAYVPPEARTAMLADARAREDVQVADYEMVQVEMDEDQKRAQIVVDMTWMLRSEGLVRQSTFEQTWERREGHWTMVREKRLSGPPLPKAAAKEAAVSAASSERSSQ
jgi:hypothetical protein